MSAREIITLQFGHYSNYVGTHWWNLQEFGFNYNSNITEISEINHDVLYREGRTLTGETTYTPRLLLVDLKSSLKSLPQHGILYDDSLSQLSENDFLWDDKKVEVQKDHVIHKTKYQQALASTANDGVDNINNEEEIRVWSDFMYARFHPRSVHIVKEYEHDSDTVPFDVFPMGNNLWNSEAFRDHFADNIRKYVEECDAFQGFHILLDATNAFAGLSTSCMEYLSDEYEAKSRLSFPLFPSYYRDYDHSTDEELAHSQLKDSIRVLNTALCFDALKEHCDMFVPLSVASNGWRRFSEYRQFGHLDYDCAHFHLGDMCSALTQHGRKMVAASVCLPFAFNVGADLLHCLDQWDGPLTRSITPEFETINDNVVQMITLRGIGEAELKKPFERAGYQRDLPAYKCNTINELLTMYLGYRTDRSLNDITNIGKALDVRVPFPRIFSERINKNGCVDSTDRPTNDCVLSVPVMTGLHSHSNLGKSLESLHTEVRRIKIARLHQFSTAGLEKDDYSECLDRLFDFRECYEDNYFL